MVTSMEPDQTKTAKKTHEHPLILTPHYCNPYAKKQTASEQYTPKVESQPEILEDSLLQQMVTNFL